eukprot:gene15102-20320_t
MAHSIDTTTLKKFIQPMTYKQYKNTVTFTFSSLKSASSCNEIESQIQYIKMVLWKMEDSDEDFRVDKTSPPNLPIGPISSTDQNFRRQPSKCSVFKCAGHNSRNFRNLDQQRGDSSNDEDENDEDNHSEDLEGFDDPQAGEELDVQAQLNEQSRIIWTDHVIEPIPTVPATRDSVPKPVDIDSLYPNFRGPARASLVQHKGYTLPHHQYMEEFWTAAMFKQFVDNTNEYAINTGAKKWYKLTVVELKTFLANVIHLGLIKYPTRDWAWQDCKDYGSTKFCYGSMTKSRFEMILKYLYNWYTSIAMVIFLLINGIYFYGTIKANRKDVPKENIFPHNTKLPRGSMRTKSTQIIIPNTNQRRNIYFISWLDNSSVQMVSSLVPYSTICERKDKSVPGVVYRKTKLAQPSVIKMYNQTMGGTDGMDQKVSYYKTMVKKKKWPWVIISHFLHVSIVNAHILYKLEHNPKRGDEFFELVDFIRGISSAWRTVPKSFTPHKKMHRVSEKNPNRHLNTTHIPGHLTRSGNEDGRR